MNKQSSTSGRGGYWLAKSEPSTYSIQDLAREQETWWDGVRNYQARNYLRSMQVGDMVLIYHSSVTPPGVVGFAEVVVAPKADPTQFQSTSPYYDPKSTPENPRWFCPKLRFVCSFDTPVLLPHLKEDILFDDLPLTQKGSRLSVMPVKKIQFERIAHLGGAGDALGRKVASAG